MNRRIFWMGFFLVLTSCGAETGVVACDDCTIRLEEVVVLGSIDDPASVLGNAASLPCAVSRLESGEYVVAALVGGGDIFVYGSDGVFDRRVGRAGQGPGEFGPNLQVVGISDTMVVIDWSSRRVSALTADGSPIRSFVVDQGRSLINTAVLPSGDLIVHQQSGDADEPLFRRWSADGEELGAFGVRAPGPGGLDQHLVRPGRGGGFWTAGVWRYELKHWQAGDSVPTSLTRAVDWFPPGEWDGRTWPPPPMLAHVWESLEGHVWTYVAVQDPEADPNPGAVTLETLNTTFDMVIEALDPETGEALGHLRNDHFLGPVCGTPLMFEVIESDAGDTRVRVLEPVLVGESDGA